jgi:hypothetical protein
MQFVLNGMLQTDATLKLFKAADGDVVNVRVFSDAGVPEDCDTDTVTLELYDTTDRRNAVTKSIALAGADDDLGELSFTPTVASVDFGPGTYYAFLKHIAGTVTTISTNYAKITVG